MHLSKTQIIQAPLRLDLNCIYSKLTGMKKLFVPVLISLCFLTACKEEAPANVQEGVLAPIVSEKYVAPAPMPEDTSGDGYIDMTRYSMEGVNKYQLGDTLVGTWQGVEGTSLTIQRDGQEYQVTVVDLDGARKFPGQAVDDGIAFERDGKTETIRVGDGIDTGMKWLADKIDCVVINAGSEGYCRDEESQPLDAETK